MRCQNAPKRARMRQNASEVVRTSQNMAKRVSLRQTASECVKTLQNASKRIKTLQNVSERIRTHQNLSFLLNSMIFIKGNRSMHYWIISIPLTLILRYFLKKINSWWRALTTCIKYRIPTVLLTKEQAYLLINHAMWCNTLIERTRGVR